MKLLDHRPKADTPHEAMEEKRGVSVSSQGLGPTWGGFLGIHTFGSEAKPGPST